MRAHCFAPHSEENRRHMRLRKKAAKLDIQDLLEIAALKGVPGVGAAGALPDGPAAAVPAGDAAADAAVPAAALHAVAAAAADAALGAGEVAEPPPADEPEEACDEDAPDDPADEQAPGEDDADA